MITPAEGANVTETKVLLTEMRKRFQEAEQKARQIKETVEAVSKAVEEFNELEGKIEQAKQAMYTLLDERFRDLQLRSFSEYGANIEKSIELVQARLEAAPKNQEGG